MLLILYSSCLVRRAIPDLFDLWINDNPRGADPLIDSANSTIDSIIVRENTLLTIYDEPNFQGNIILQESGPKGFYSHTVSQYIIQSF